MKRLIPGREINLGGRLMIVPPLNFALIRKFEETIKQVQAEAHEIAEQGASGMSGFDISAFLPCLEKAMPVITAAIQRNYPQWTDEQTLNYTDSVNFRTLWESAMGSIPEGLLIDHDEGEAQPAAEESIGPSFTAVS